MDQHHLITGLLQLCQRASEAILKVYQDDELVVETKQDNSPITQADLAAHQIIQAGLSELTPSIPQLSEEAEIPFEERKNWSTFWCIDPLDGTKEFINRNGEFTINIALIEQGHPTLGIIFIPLTGIAYWGGTQIKAWKKHPDTPAAQIRSRPLGSELIVTSSRRHGQNEPHNLLHPIAERFQLITSKNMGSSLKMCLIAEGGADFYPRLFPTSEWDTAAAQAIVEAAGGKLVDANDLRPLRYNRRSSLINPDFYVCGDPLFPLEELRPA